jgi:hypothetical protein
VAKFTGCYVSVKDLDESGKTKDDIVLNAMNLYKQKVGKAFVLKHCWLLLKIYPRFATIFMGKWKAAGFDLPAPNLLPVDRRDALSPNPNGEALPTESAPAQIRPQGAKSSKAEHLKSKVKEQALRAHAKATTNFVVATLKKAEKIAQQNAFSLFTLEDRLITCDIARQWFHLRMTQELAKLKGEFVASNMPTPPLVGVCSSPPPISPAPAPVAAHAPAHVVAHAPAHVAAHAPAAAPVPDVAPAPAPTPTQHQGLGTQTPYQGLGFRDLNHVADAPDAGDDDDCAELDDEDDVFLDREYEVVSLTDMRRVSDLNSFRNDFSQAASDREEDTTIILDSEVSEFHINPPPSQRRRLSVDPHDMHAAHVGFWNSRIREDYANRHIFSQPAHIPSPHNSYTIQSWLQGARA